MQQMCVNCFFRDIPLAGMSCFLSNIVELCQICKLDIDECWFIYYYVHIKCSILGGQYEREENESAAQIY